MKITTRTQKGYEAIIEGRITISDHGQVVIGSYIIEKNNGKYMVVVTKQNAEELVGMKLPSGYTKGLVSIANYNEFIGAVEELKNEEKRIEDEKKKEANNMKIISFEYTVGCDAPSYRIFKYEKPKLSKYRNDESLGKQLQAQIKKSEMKMNIDSTYSTYGGYRLEGNILQDMIALIKTDTRIKEEKKVIAETARIEKEEKRINNLIKIAKKTGEKQVINSSFNIESKKDCEIYHYETEYIDAAGNRTTENRQVEMS